MAADYLPHRQADLLQWSSNYSAQLNSNPGNFGVSPAQAASYALKHDAFASAMEIIDSPSSRTPVAIASKNIAKRELEIAARELAQLIQNTPGMDNQKRILLGLSPHREASRHDASANALAAPRASHAAERPRLSARAVAGRQVRLYLSDRSSMRRGRPIDAAGAMIFSFVGLTPPPDEMSEWKFEGLATRNTRDVRIPSSVPNGSTIWFTACWYNTRGQTGANCEPVYTNIAGGLAKAA